MGRKGRPRLRTLRAELARAYPSITDPDGTIRRGEVLVNGLVNANPESLVRAGSSIVLRVEIPLRGEAKLNAALEAFAIDARDRVALDIGAAAGGFSRALLAAGARRVYAVDVGYGQLLGSLRQDRRVISLESTNLSDLNTVLVPEEIDLVTLDLSYLALRVAVPELERIRLSRSAQAVALVKPQFELGLGEPPRSRAQLLEAVAMACEGFRAGWAVDAWIESSVRGRGGSIEFFVHAVRR